MKLPYGVTDFAHIRRSGSVYVDRSTHIARLEALGEPILFVRPRRFGKSLLVDMLRCYYDLRLADAHDELFGGLAVGSAPTAGAHRYYVLAWDFSNVDPTGTARDIGRRLGQYVLGTLEDFQTDYREHLPPFDVIEDPVRSLGHLLTAVRQTPYRLHLLVDEYDNFANEVVAADPDAYRELVAATGPFKQLFQWVKAAMQGKGLERLFLTGVSPVVMMDLTSGLNICRNVSLHPDLDDLCGFRAEEVRALVTRALTDAGPGAPPVEEALEMMRTWYDGYRFAHGGRLIYNPTLTLYFLLDLLEQRRYPRELLDANLAGDEQKLDLVGRLGAGRPALLELIQTGKPLEVGKLKASFRLSELLRTAETGQADGAGAADMSLLGSFLYYFGMLTLAGETSLGAALLDVPNLVVRKLYIDEVARLLLPQPAERSAARRPAAALAQDGDIGPLAELIESKVLRVFSNRDYRWLNELAVKTAFLALLFDDRNYYVVASESGVDRGYADLCLLRRPDARARDLWDLLLEFKYIKLADLRCPGAELRELDEAELGATKAVANALADAEQQLARYRAALAERHGDSLRLRSYAVVALGFERLLAREVRSG